MYHHRSTTTGAWRRLARQKHAELIPVGRMCGHFAPERVGVCVDDGAQGVEEVWIKEDPRSEASYPPSQSMSTSLTIVNGSERKENGREETLSRCKVPPCSMLFVIPVEEETSSRC